PHPSDAGHRPAQSPAAASAAEEPAGVVVPSESALARFGPGIRQQLATVIDRVFLTVSRKGARTLGFSSIDGDGASGALTAAAAELLAQRTSASVCVVDTHVGLPSVHQHFGV